MDIKELINNPSESLAVELKPWTNPDRNPGKSIIIKAVLAMRNNNGGYILFGFHNRTLLPIQENIPSDIKSRFHIDKIQSMVTKFSSEPFEVTIHFPERDGLVHPVIEVPSGVEIPVITKSRLKSGENTLIELNRVYIRSLNANNTPSTTEATWRDWDKIMRICFDNREADIGRFFRRHISGIKEEVIQISDENQTEKIIKKGESYFLKEIREKNLTLPDHGVWEIGLSIIGECNEKFSPNHKFLDLLYANNPHYTGWPVWLDSRRFKDEKCKPNVIDGAWQALIITFSGSSKYSDIEFWRLDPSGKFYLRRALEDDIGRSRNQPPPLSQLDFGLVIVRVAEAIGVAKSYATAMGYSEEDTVLEFVFKWAKLNGRELSSWSAPQRRILSGKIAKQDELLTEIQMPLDVPYSALGEYVYLATKSLFEIFDGTEIPSSIVDELTESILKRGKT